MHLQFTIDKLDASGTTQHNLATGPGSAAAACRLGRWGPASTRGPACTARWHRAIVASCSWQAPSAWAGASDPAQVASCAQPQLHRATTASEVEVAMTAACALMCLNSVLGGAMSRSRICESPPQAWRRSAATWWHLRLRRTRCLLADHRSAQRIILHLKRAAQSGGCRVEVRAHHSCAEERNASSWGPGGHLPAPGTAGRASCSRRYHCSPAHKQAHASESGAPAADTQNACSKACSNANCDTHLLACIPLYGARRLTSSSAGLVHAYIRATSACTSHVPC